MLWEISTKKQQNKLRLQNIHFLPQKVIYLFDTLDCIQATKPDEHWFIGLSINDHKVIRTSLAEVAVETAKGSRLRHIHTECGL